MWTEHVLVSTWGSLFISSVCHCLRVFEKRHDISTRLTGSQWFRKTGWLGCNQLINHQASVGDIPAVNIRWFSITLPSLSALWRGRNTQILTMWPPKSCLSPRWGGNHSSTSPEHFQYKRGQQTAKATPEWKGRSNGQSHLSLIVVFSCSYAFVPSKGNGSIIDEKAHFLHLSEICICASSLPSAPFDTLNFPSTRNCRLSCKHL